jgi:hypothetical protein
MYFKRVQGPPLFLCIFFLSTFYLLHKYVLNSDEGLTDRALVSKEYDNLLALF